MEKCDDYDDDSSLTQQSRQHCNTRCEQASKNHVPNLDEFRRYLCCLRWDLTKKTSIAGKWVDSTLGSPSLQLWESWAVCFLVQDGFFQWEQRGEVKWEEIPFKVHVWFFPWMPGIHIWWVQRKNMSLEIHKIVSLWIGDNANSGHCTSQSQILGNRCHNRSAEVHRGTRICRPPIPMEQLREAEVVGLLI